jgi:hypothetical protein
MTPFFQSSRSMAGKIFGGIYAEMRSSIEVQVTPFFWPSRSMAGKIFGRTYAEPFIGVRPQYFQAI